MRQNSQERFYSATEIPTMEVAGVPTAGTTGATTTTTTTTTGATTGATMNEPSLVQDALETTVNTQLLPTEPVDESRLRRLFCFCCYCCCVYFEQTRRIPKTVRIGLEQQFLACVL